MVVIRNEGRKGRRTGDRIHGLKGEIRIGRRSERKRGRQAGRQEGRREERKIDRKTIIAAASDLRWNIFSRFYDLL